MKVLSLAGKTIKEYLRNRRTLLLALALPVAFMLIFGLAFQGRQNGTFDVHTYNADGSARPYLDALAAAKYPDGQRIFGLTGDATLAACVESVKSGDADVCLEIPNNFATAPKVVVTMHADPAKASGQAATSAATRVLAGFNPNPRVSAQPAVVTAPNLSTFDIIAPGLMVFAVLNLAPQFANALAKEVEQRTLTRLRLTRVRTAEFLLGVGLGQYALSATALVLMFAAAAAMRFHFRSWGSTGAAFLVALAATVAVLGMGMIIAAFSRSPEHASGLGILVAVPGSFLSGAFFPIPPVNLFKVPGRTIQLYDVLPTTHAVRALRALLTFDQGIDTVTFELAALGVLSILYFAVGAWCFRRNHMRPE